MLLCADGSLLALRRPLFPQFGEPIQHSAQYVGAERRALESDVSS